MYQPSGLPIPQVHAMHVAQGFVSNMYLSRPWLEAKKGRTVANREIQGVVHDIILIPPEKFGAAGAVQGERQLIAAQNNI